MHILFIDCDSLRPDHLGSYGYHRDTSPNIDALAESGRRFTNYYASDVPCLPSRTALFSGRFGIHTGVVNHGGINADVRPRGSERGFNTQHDAYRSLPTVLRQAGFQTAFISPFPQRHGAWHTVDGFDEWIDTGGNGNERADVVTAHADRWLDEHAEDDAWYLHVNFWDPHTPYDTPMAYGNPFADDDPPAWPDADTIAEQYAGYGPHSAHEPHAWGDPRDLERTPDEIDSREAFTRWIDGYDVGIRYLDDHIGELVDRLEEAGVREDTLIIVSADHGENHGELNVYGDHQTADDKTCRVPFIVNGPGVEPGVDDGLHYQIDGTMTLAEFAGGDVPEGWDGRSFASSLEHGETAGREFLILSQGAWACQRAVRWDDWLLIRTYHDGLKDFEPVELYDLAGDPHETNNLAQDRPAVAREALGRLEQWVSTRLLESATDRAGGNAEAPNAVIDPLFEVLQEGGPFHAKADVQIPHYAERLRETDRDAHAEKLETHRGIVPQDVDAYLTGEDVWS